jgi:hypothetical protein
MKPAPQLADGRLLDILSRPSTVIPASALMHAGLSAYGNALSQNELEKGDNRLILESILAGLGSIGGHTLLRGLGPRLKRAASELPAAEKAAIKAVLAQNPEIGTLRKAMPAVGSIVLSGTGASLAGNVLAPFVAGNLNLAGLPGWSGRQQDYYEQDQEPAVDPRVLALLEARG